MDGLRWWLLIFGVIVVAGVYAYTRLQRKKAADSPQQDLFAEKKESFFQPKAIRTHLRLKRRTGHFR